MSVNVPPGYKQTEVGEPPAQTDWSAETPEGYEVSGDPVLDLAVRVDTAVKRVRPDGWRGIQAREQTIKGALYEILKDEAEVERIFLVVQAQREY